MKRYLITLSIILSIISSFWYTYAIQALEKKVVVKQRILAHAELKKHVAQGEWYIAELNAFLTKYKNDEERLQNILEKVQKAKTWLGSNSDMFKILNYLEYSILYTFIENNITPTTPTTPTITGTGSSQNEKTLSEVVSLQKLIDAKLAKKEIKIQNVVGGKIDEKTSENSYFLLGYPNYSALGIKQSDYQDSYNQEYFIVVLVTHSEASYQILGYLEKNSTTKTALVKGNYVKKVNYPDSLFVDPETKKYIVTGSDFKID